MKIAALVAAAALTFAPMSAMAQSQGQQYGASPVGGGVAGAVVGDPALAPTYIAIAAGVVTTGVILCVLICDDDDSRTPTTTTTTTTTTTGASE